MNICTQTHSFNFCLYAYISNSDLKQKNNSRIRHFNQILELFIKYYEFYWVK